jgi:endonuclease-3
VKANEKTQRRLLLICDLLRKTFGISHSHPARDPLDTLISTVLSQNTSDVNSARAFRNLKHAFPTWEKAHRASRREIEKAIASGGLGKTKSFYIKQILAAAADEKGKPSLASIRKMNTPEAREFLCSLPGVGMKTASCVLLFALGRPVCPVDTHVLRVGKRLRLIEENLSADQAALALEAILPDDCMLTFHLGLIQIGRAACRPRLPHHEECLLRELCPSARPKRRQRPA